MKTTNSLSEKYNNWIERYTREIQEQLKQAEESISGPEHMSLEIIESEGKKEKGIKKREQSLNDLWDFIRRPIYILWETQKKKKEKYAKSIFKEIIAESFPKLRKDVITQMQKAQLIPIRINSNRLYQDIFY